MRSKIAKRGISNTDFASQVPKGSLIQYFIMLATGLIKFNIS